MPRAPRAFPLSLATALFIVPAAVAQTPREAAPQTPPPPRAADTPAPRGPSVPLSVRMLESSAGRPAEEGGGGAQPGSSLLAIVAPPPRTFEKHDLVTIIVSEQSKAKSKSKMKTHKSYTLEAEVSEFWNFDFGALGDDARLQGNQLPGVAVDGDKKFDGKGDYQRNDDFTARITAEVVSVRPNGTIVLEAYKEIRLDNEIQVIRLTGECRPQDVDATNMVQSHRLANALVEKTTTGELRDASEKGIIAKILDAVFAF